MSDRVLVVYKDRYDGVTRSLKIPKDWAEKPRQGRASLLASPSSPRLEVADDRAATVPLFRDWNPEALVRFVEHEEAQTIYQFVLSEIPAGGR